MAKEIKYLADLFLALEGSPVDYEELRRQAASLPSAKHTESTAKGRKEFGKLIRASIERVVVENPYYQKRREKKVKETRPLTPRPISIPKMAEIILLSSRIDISPDTIQKAANGGGISRDSLFKLIAGAFLLHPVEPRHITIDDALDLLTEVETFESMMEKSREKLGLPKEQPEAPSRSRRTRRRSRSQA